MYKRKSSDCQISSVVRSASNHQWGVETWSRSSYIQMELAAGYHPTSSQPTNGWISSPRTSFLSTPRTQTPTGRILSSKTCVRILMQMAGSVCSCSAQNCHFLHLHLYLTNVLKKHFYFLFPGIHEVHLDPHMNIQSTILCPATTLCYL